MWIRSSKLEMATIGPIVRNEVFFFVVILGVAALVVLREWFSAEQPAEEAARIPPSGDARMGVPPAAALEFRGGDFVRRGGGFVGGEFVYARAAAAPPPREGLTARGQSGAHSAVRSDGFEPAFLYRGCERHA